MLQSLTTADSVSFPTITAIGANFSAEEGVCALELGGGVNAIDSPLRVLRVSPVDGEGHSALVRAAVEVPRHAATLAYAVIVAGLSVWSMACG